MTLDMKRKRKATVLVSVRFDPEELERTRRVVSRMPNGSLNAAICESLRAWTEAAEAKE